MNLPPLHVAELLRRYGHKPKKGLGQNFLTDEIALQKIIAAAEIPPQTDVLEIGPGLGSLTRHLANQCQRVVAVELDSTLFPILKEVLKPWKNVELIQGDILEIDPADHFPQQGYWVVANIPYYITSAVIRHLLEAGVKPARIVLTVQQEVAQRICAKAGDMSLLALSVQIYGSPSICVHIPSEAFYPAPKIDSSAVRIDLYPQPLIENQQIDAFFVLAKSGFSQKRKTLRNSLSGGLHCSTQESVSLLELAGIDPQRRAQTLSIAEWAKLTTVFTNKQS